MDRVKWETLRYKRRRRLGRNISNQVRVGDIKMKWCFTEDTSIWRDR